MTVFIKVAYRILKIEFKKRLKFNIVANGKKDANIFEMANRRAKLTE